MLKEFLEYIKKESINNESTKDKIIKVKIKPNSCCNEIYKYSNDRWIIKIKERAKEGKANIELIKFLKKITKKDVRIIKGLTKDVKIIRIG